MKYSKEETSIIEKWVKENILDNEMICKTIINISPKDVDLKIAGKYYSNFDQQITFGIAINGLPEFLEGYPSKNAVNTNYYFESTMILGKAIAKIKMLQIKRDSKIASIEHAEEVERRVEEALRKLKEEK